MKQEIKASKVMIPSAIYREIKIMSAARGINIRKYLLEAVMEKIDKDIRKKMCKEILRIKH